MLQKDHADMCPTHSGSEDCTCTTEHRIFHIIQEYFNDRTKNPKILGLTAQEWSVAILLGSNNDNT